MAGSSGNGKASGHGKECLHSWWPRGGTLTRLVTARTRGDNENFRQAARDPKPDIGPCLGHRRGMLAGPAGTDTT